MGSFAKIFNPVGSVVHQTISYEKKIYFCNFVLKDAQRTTELSHLKLPLIYKLVGSEKNKARYLITNVSKFIYILINYLNEQCCWWLYHCWLFWYLFTLIIVLKVRINFKILLHKSLKNSFMNQLNIFISYFYVESRLLILFTRFFK